MSAKHFVDDPTDLVNKSLRSLPRTNPLLSVDVDNKIVFLRSSSKPQVSLVSGGGSGHEPSFGGLVGPGFLTAAVAGTIFASPSASQIRKCLLHRVDSRKGVLVIVMNYTGDGLNFGVAVEKAKATGINIDMLIVGDDVGVGRSRNGRIGRRGIAGTVLVQKVAGAAAASGLSLKDVYKVAKAASANLVSVGASLAHVHVPGRAPTDDSLAIDGKVEIGMGIHNEEGVGKIQAELADLVKTMLAQLLDATDMDRAFVHIESTDSIFLLLNNLGGVSPLEFGAVVDEVCTQLEAEYSIRPVRVLAGTFMTSLNGMGFSISLLKLVDTGFGDVQRSMLEFLDAPTEATGWAAAVQPTSWRQTQDLSVPEINNEIKDVSQASNLRLNPQVAERMLRSGLQRVIAAEPDVTRFDTIVGDGDCGIGIKRGATAVLDYISRPPPEDAVRLLSEICSVVEKTMDGTSGAIYSIFLNALTYGLAIQDVDSTTLVRAPIWARALSTALESLSKYTPAQPGDRTLVDALHPFVKTMEDVGDLQKAAAAAQKGAESTKGMEASLGRTVYVGGNAFKSCPDPGAYALSELLLGLSVGK